MKIENFILTHSYDFKRGDVHFTDLFFFGQDKIYGCLHFYCGHTDELTSFVIGYAKYFTPSKK